MKIRINKGYLKDQLGIRKNCFGWDDAQDIELEVFDTCCQRNCGRNYAHGMIEHQAYQRGYYDGKRDGYYQGKEDYRSFRDVEVAELVKKIKECTKPLDELKKELGIG